MTPFAHGVVVVAYGLLAVVVGFAANAIFDESPVLVALAVFLICALLHEVLARRATEKRLVRSMSALKRAYDRIEDEAGTTPMRPLGAPTTAPTATPAPPAETAPARNRTETAAAPSFSPSHNQPADAGQEPSLVRTEPPAPQDTAADAAELGVLQRLLETLQTVGPPRGVEGDAGDSPPPPSDRTPLRVVGGADGGSADGKAATDPLAMLRESLEQDRVDLYLQPIVSLPQRKRRFYECYSRVRDAEGVVLRPGTYIGPAKSAGLLTSIDNILLFRCLQLLGKLHRRDSTAVFFCNLSANTLRDDDFVRDIVTYMERHKELASNVVLEVAQSDLADAPDDLDAYFTTLRDAGYRFSMDGVTDLDLDMPGLAKSGFRSVKIAAKLLLEVIEAGQGAAVRTLKQQLDQHGIDLIVERIESERMLLDLLDFNIDYGQGYLFGEPRPSKDPGLKGSIGSAG
ncbi:EAL domain-containing protein [Hwanghaeella grinnelliae]|uniref:EAL domain-containing protein n=1 Tax=Hwanghaeella grinnelliae TaxID=2500179 RepID=A0A3S2W8M1_9PROT|nr:EAL domain-containing protein [Hwanghaeella grinnelliae]RVU35890.1 EAL domain-containing protein [Hwanghaeella grinnelliae]